MKLVKIKTLGKDGKTYYPIYLLIEMQVNGLKSIKVVRVYTHKDDKNGYDALSISAIYASGCAKIGDYVQYMLTGDEKYLHTAQVEEKKKK